MSSRAVRVRLTAAATLVTALVLVGAAALLLVLFWRTQVDAADDLSRGRAADLARLAQRDAVPPLIADVGDDSVAQVVGRDGTVLGASGNLGDAPAVSTYVPPDGAARQLDLDGVPDDDETEDYRAWALRAEAPDGPVVVYVGTARESTRETVTALAVSLAVGLPVVLLVAAGLLWGLVGRTLRPVEEAHARQRAFVADAAHELQSPLAAYRAALEVGLAYPDVTDWPETARELLDDGERMERLVRDLLFLARQDDAPSVTRPVDLDDVVLEEVRRLRTGRGIEVDASGVSAGPVLGSRPDLARMVRNLLENAQRHARSRVVVTLASTADGVRLTVSDDGPGVAPHHRGHVFERFYRGDEARAHETGSTGLGLAIVRAVAQRHGGSAELGPADPGATFVVRLPTS